MFPIKVSEISNPTIPVDWLILGIVWSILSFACKNIGYGYQKRGINLWSSPGAGETATTDGKQVVNTSISSLFRNKAWMVGFLLAMFGAIALVIAYRYIPITISMSFTGLGLVIFVIFAKFNLKEQITKSEWASILVIVGGMVLVGINLANVTAESPLLAFYWGSFGEMGPLFYFGICGAVVIISILWTRRHNWRGAGLIFALAGGIIGGLGVIFQKPLGVGIGQLDLAHLFVEHAEPNWWLMFVASGLILIISIFGGVFMLNWGYTKGEGILVAPTYAVTVMVIPIIGGAICFGEWNVADPVALGLELLGIAVIAVGTFCLSYYNNKKLLKNVVPPQRT